MIVGYCRCKCWGRSGLVSMAWLLCVILTVCLRVEAAKREAPLESSEMEKFGPPKRVASMDSSVEEFKAHGDVFGRLCALLDQPCGEEMIPGNNPDLSHGKTFRVKRSTPRRSLDEFVRQHPSYRWVISEGVLILEPRQRSGVDVLSRKLDRVRINDTSSFKAALDIFKQAGISVTWTIRANRYARIDLELRNVTVREALNAIVKADGQAIWKFASNGTKKEGQGSFAMGTWRESGGIQPVDASGNLQ